MAVGFGVGVAVGNGVGVGTAVGDGDGLTATDGVGDTDGIEDGVGDGLTSIEGDGDIVGVGVGAVQVFSGLVAGVPPPHSLVGVTVHVYGTPGVMGNALCVVVEDTLTD